MLQTGSLQKGSFRRIKLQKAYLAIGELFRTIKMVTSLTVAKEVSMSARHKKKICTEVFTAAQDDWGPSEYGFLYARTERFFDDSDKYAPAILSLDTSKMTNVTKLIIKTSLNYYGKLDETIARFPNLKEVKAAKPLDKPLQISRYPYGKFKEFEDVGLIL